MNSEHRTTKCELPFCVDADKYRKMKIKSKRVEYTRSKKLCGYSHKKMK